MKIFLDANVLFTAIHNPKGKSAFIIKLCKENKFEIISCGFAIEEAVHNLKLKYPETEKHIQKIVSQIKIVPTVLSDNCPINIPKKDIPIFMSALNAKSTHLITGDIRDFGKFMNNPARSQGLLIQTPADFLLGF